jgi:hypothetical protein
MATCRRVRSRSNPACTDRRGRLRSPRRMGRKRWTGLVVALLGALVVAVPSAYACPSTATDCSESGNITMQPNSYGSQSTDVTPTGATKGAIDDSPLGSAGVSAFDNMWQTVATAFPKLGGIKNVFVRRVITCAIFARQFTDLYGVLDKTLSGSDTATATDTSELFLTLCVQAAYQGQLAMSGHVAHSASTACSTAIVSIPIEIERDGGQYKARFSAKPTKATKPPLVVSCKVNGSSTLINMHPRARRKKLYKVIGNHLSIGFSNPAQTPVAVHTVFKFK